MLEGKIEFDEENRIAYSEFLREQGVLEDNEWVTPIRMAKYVTKKGKQQCILTFHLEASDAAG